MGPAARAVGMTALLFLAAGGLPAQERAGPAAASPFAGQSQRTGVCLASVPDSLLTVQDTVYLHALVLDPGARTLLPEADLLAQRVAARGRRLLGAGGDAVPPSDPSVRWQDDLGGNLAVGLHRDGRATWAELLPMPLPDTAPTRFLARALDSVLTRHEAVGWSVEAARESVVVRLGLDHRVEPVWARGLGLGFPMFVVRRPREERPVRISGPFPRYPEGQKSRGIVAQVTMAVTVDTAGRPEPGSVFDVWPDTLPPLAGKDADDYEAFVAAARESLQRTVFRPGRIGGCAVRVRITMPFNFTVDSQ